MVFAMSTVHAVQNFDGLRIVVLEGEDSVNIIAQGTAVPTLVEVRDRNDVPVAGASVVFLLQGGGTTATLNAGLSQLALTTNALGQNPMTAALRHLTQPEDGEIAGVRSLAASSSAIPLAVAPSISSRPFKTSNSMRATAPLTYSATRAVPRARTAMRMPRSQFRNLLLSCR